MSETEILIKIINEVKPDLMYPIHNSGFGGSYFFISQDFDDAYYDNIINFTKELGIPLHLGVPEEDFMESWKKPFYKDFGAIEYIEREIKLGRDPKKTLKHGDNSMSYLKKINHAAISIVGEIPYFYDKKTLDETETDRDKREVFLEIIERNEKNYEFYKKFLPEVLSKLNEPDPHWYVMKHLERQIGFGLENFKNHVKTSEKYSGKATRAEVFDSVVTERFYRTLMLGQLRRAAIKAKLENEKIKEIEKRIKEEVKIIDENSNWKVFPIKKLVQLQILFLFETLKAIERKEEHR